MTADSFSLAGKVAIVTGSGRENGIGAAIARALARNEAAVVVNYVSESSAQRAARVVEEISKAGGQAISIRADVSIVKEAEGLVSKTLEAFKVDHIDILVNNAGVGWPHTTLDISEGDMEKILKVNILGTVRLIRATLPYMPKGGRVINIGSVASKVGMPALPIYGASKAALDNLTYTWAQEFGVSKGITVNTVAPGPVVTDIAPGVDEGLLSLTRAEKRPGTADDIADVVLLVAQERSRWLTGQYLSASGGITGQ